MDRWQRTAVFFAVLALAGVMFLAGLTVGTERLFAPGGDGIEQIRDAYEKIRSQSADPPSEDELVEGAIRGMVQAARKAGDPYAAFYGPEGYRAFEELSTGEFSGIGVRLEPRDGRLEVLSAIAGTPAADEGLQARDVITAVNGRPVGELTLDAAATAIKGPAGTEVTLSIARGTKTFNVTLTRETIRIPNVSGRLIEKRLGYIRLYGFGNGASDDVRDKVDHLLANGAQGVVLDLRDNPGGLFEEAVDVASLFIEDGTIVTYRDRLDEETVYEAEGDAYENLPLVVLVNGGSASASEIVAGALQDRERATLVGETTYGKGAVQQVFPLPGSSALKVTTASYFTPSGTDLNGRGVDPDIRIAGAKAQRARAAAVLRGLVTASAGDPA